MYSKIWKLSASLLLAMSVAPASAQEKAGDDYQNTCTTTYSTTNTIRYGGIASCLAYGGLNGLQYLQLTQFVAPQSSKTIFLTGIAPTGQLLSCTANVPYYDTLTTTTPTTTCSVQPRAPFIALSAYTDDCVDSPVTLLGELYWSYQSGDTYEVQARFRDAIPFTPFWSGSISAPFFYLPFEYARSRPVEYRLRTTRNGTSGSWSYIAPNCVRDRHER